MNAWDRLPNAKHIDWVLASIKEHPEKWNAARNVALMIARNVAWNVAWHVVLTEVRNAARAATWGVVWPAPRGVILALIAYDDCAYMIESDVDSIKILAALGDPKAILLLPACIVFNETKSLQMA